MTKTMIMRRFKRATRKRRKWRITIRPGTTHFVHGGHIAHASTVDIRFGHLRSMCSKTPTLLNNLPRWRTWKSCALSLSFAEFLLSTCNHLCVNWTIGILFRSYNAREEKFPTFWLLACWLLRNKMLPTPPAEKLWQLCPLNPFLCSSFSQADEDKVTVMDPTPHVMRLLDNKVC